MATQPVEDIDAVLGRFQAWTGTRNAVEARPGIRETSEEEALASGRYRWKRAGAGASTAKKTAVPPQPAVAPDASEHSKTTAAKSRNLSNRTRKAHVKSQVPARPAVSAKPAIAKPSSPAKEVSRPAFREVLAEAVRPAEVFVAAQPMELSRQVAISIRLAPSERALIKTRAAEAGITASAYVRQCALEVEQLRAQVRAAVAAMEHGSATAAQGSTAAPLRAPGFFARIARRFFSRSAPVLALRA